jgi:shikimate kinase
MSGSGKSYWAQQIAAHYKLQCIDLDDIIEVRTGMTISAFFKRFGEEEFRKLERLTLIQVLEVFAHNCVIACGGGTPCFFDNMALIQQSGRVIYLEADIDFLQNNIAQEQQQRPLLEEGDLEERLSGLLRDRKKVYEQADFTLKSEALQLQDFEGIIQQSLL